MNNKILSCDWGTSSFRLHLIEVESQNFLASVQSHQGTAKTYQGWKGQSKLDQFQYFKTYLRSQINALQELVADKLTHLPIYVSGMASSSIGMRELPYADLPLTLSGEGLVWEKFGANDFFPHPLYLISGAKNHRDVMRGEEIQMIGIAKCIAESSFVGIFPGTHSKHIWVEQEQIKDFQTYMTGEIFQVLGKHSILSNSIPKKDPVLDLQAFKEGTIASHHSPLLHNLFSVRAHELIKQTSKNYNFYYLSGLLIGHELAQLKDTKIPIFLCGGDKLSIFYQTAFEVLNIKTQIISSEIVERAVGIGHCKLILK